MRYTPYAYQRHAEQHIIDNNACALFLEMGLGKTVSTLTAIDRLINETLEVARVLVIAPKRVAEDTWSTEVEKWDHLRHLRISKVLGDEKKRKAALKAPADIYIINRENVPWLVAHYGSAFPFDMVVLDELSSFKSPTARRFKALREVRPKVSRVVGLTGTPAPNSLLDLWSQVYLLDMGKRLGEKLTDYREKLFVKDPYKPYASYELREGSEEFGQDKDFYRKKIYEKIEDICISMKAADYLELPERVDRTVSIRLSPDVQAAYEDFERRKVLELLDEEQISAVNAAALTNKLLQFANGAIYDEDKNFHEMHSEKLAALEELIEAANGQPVLIFYWFKHDLQRILHHLKAYKPRQLQTSEDIRLWNAGGIQVLLAHPASAGHGLNLQAGGNVIVWFGHTWSLELYQQANARLHRQGQTKAVIVHHLVIAGTMDEDVLLSLEGKAEGQEALMQAVKARIEKHAKNR